MRLENGDASANGRKCVTWDAKANRARPDPRPAFIELEIEQLPALVTGLSSTTQS